ncbi:leucine-rich repeat-containing protein 27 isoform X3 [Coregonus clupeaformis]|uniref:leucine-rich repeat-containing protein 27 isoform X3 n=1 Tax=Coregonus clupeaformis TaxID=59861 RepID=UPI001BE05EE9|nr:leucine-rich repeat-containing protein 27 isoform X3 [Coregonus clupeaformis]
MSSVENEITDLHLSLDCGDNAGKTHTPHILPECVGPMQITEYVTSDTLYLSRRNLKYVVDCILKNTTLKNLYLEGNEISMLPDTLFTSLSNLVWLDLRNNQITSLPAEIGLHRCLKTVLLEGNPITELPLELGNVITLKALSLRHCPITFPPQEVVQQGLQCILQYLRSAMAERPVSVRNSLPDMPPVEKLQLTELVKSSLDLCEEVVDEDELQRFRELRQKMIQMDRAEFGFALPISRLPRAAEGDRGHNTYPLPIIKRKKEITRGNIFPELPPFDMQYCKRSEERRLAAMKELKEKQAILEQRRKDQELLKEWRTHARVMQERKILEHKQERRERHRREETLKKIVSGCADTQLRLSRSEAATGLANDGSLCLQCAESVILQSDVSSEAAPQLVPIKAPYATEALCSVAESGEVKTHKPPPKRIQRQRSFLSQKEHEEAREARDRELEQRISSHVQMVQERRRRPSGTAQEETEAARQDMEEAKRLQSELAKRKQERDIEYRFIAFTGENSPRCYDK